MNILKTVNLKNFGKKYQGKVRDYYITGDKRIIITTDRISAFDVNLGYIPHKGQVLNQLAAFWFEKTRDIVQNHILSLPDPHVVVVKNCKLIPIEMVVRGYITGVTGTSIWGSYEKGERIIYGIKFPNGLKKNQKLKKPVITPTTKAEKGHDERLTEKEILQKKIVNKKLWEQMKRAALKLFERGTKVCEKAGIILVDTKYEFGLDENNKLTLIDEVHTPDSSRFWIKRTYKERFSSGEEPKNFDKEFLRIWFAKKGYKGDGKPPKMSGEIIKKVSKRYIKIYELLTGEKFIPSVGNIEKNIEKTISKKKLAILISNKGTGTNLQGIINGVEQKRINAEISVVISDTKKALGLKRAKKHELNIEICDKKEKLLEILKRYDVDFVCLGGWKQFITKEVMDAFPNKILNAHPGIIPNTLRGVVKNPDGTKALWNKGKFTDAAIQNVLSNKATYAGSTIHALSNEFDFGKVFGRTFEKVKKNDTIKTLYTRLKIKENKLYADVLAKLCKK